MDWGRIKEIELFDIIKEAFDGNLKKTSGRYDPFDFESDDTLVELKSRRCNHDTYNTTMIPYSKLIYCNKFPDKKVILCFNFEDGLYCHTYEREKQHDIRKFNNRDYCYIPINQLIKV